MGKHLESFLKYPRLQKLHSFFQFKCEKDRKKERQPDRRLFPDVLAAFQILRSLVRAIRGSPNRPFCPLNKYYLTKQVELEQLFDELFVLICLISTQMLRLVQKENIHF